ncbi:MAG: NADH-quinone oxidoreductase subunit A [Pirellulales bacterium]|nr:NADH-quinone oxidoreductase subunit A [Pirellulales bacterium]
MSTVHIVAYLALFVTVGFLFVFVTLCVGRLLRPRDSSPQKLDIYECGEPTIGSSFVQFDLRFYVVALLFLIFDVEIAFFFPWATVFGKANHLADERVYAAANADEMVTGVYSEWGVNAAEAPKVNGEGAAGAAFIQEKASNLGLFSLADIGVFFGVLLVGFAYVWKRGDLDWVRAMQDAHKAKAAGKRGPPVPEDQQQEPALAG